ncbi:RagB/SusD family nutrient uptake outer membrane protein [Chitinophaga oryzae]|uniref:RagB/SusD family nutrient uptake outer membrane protein n=1 Tax=Chitinophaga oryzae TaxID=2725414 RepID=A0AAE6ZFA5_9BACT|nr:RagB/SusD family nutrient uptake outer membrane protein [Chitinophaga oryzae]QJB31913.1 RagB/SusD family nutrient uptake outer membrane protein [Chitinophaga oryzae]
MKLIHKLSISIACAALAAVQLSSCKKGLDYDNVGAMSPENVWKDSTMIQAYLSDIYGGLLPKWPFNGSASDEGISTPRSLGDYQRGIISASSEASNTKLDYQYIEKINYFLDNLEKAPAAVISAARNSRFAGEAKFWRAWTYWGMVRQVGGVPLVLHTQDYLNKPSLFVPRNKTSECVAQIVKDLDDAIQALPASYPDAGQDYGRITKVAAMAFKGRVLLTYASPLFNPGGDAARWQSAYNACKAAVDAAISAGHALHPNFRNIWYQERNKEVIMVNQFWYPIHANTFNSIRAEPFTRDASNDNQPLLSLLLAFPKRDGSPMQFDKNQLSDPAYNAAFMNDFYTNRDDRFYATVFYGGTPYPTPDQLPPSYVSGNSYWNVWKYDAASGRYINASPIIHPGIPGNPGITGFFDRKGLDTTVTSALVYQSGTDWPEIRFAEVLMNYGECANELGKSGEALQVLYDIRQRAGIAPGGGNTYGVTATTMAGIRDAYIRERQVEFAFEGKRFDDLRRWKRYDILNSQGGRHGLYITLKDGQMVTPSENIMDAASRAKFTARYIDNLDGDAGVKFNLDLNHWFFALKPDQISQSQNVLLQNKEWGGSFDPLQ